MALEWPDVDDHDFFVWSSWKSALAVKSSQDAELEHTLWARVHPRSFGRVQMGFVALSFQIGWGLHYITLHYITLHYLHLRGPRRRHYIALHYITLYSLTGNAAPTRIITSLRSSAGTVRATYAKTSDVFAAPGREMTTHVAAHLERDRAAASPRRVTATCAATHVFAAPTPARHAMQ